MALRISALAREKILSFIFKFSTSLKLIPFIPPLCEKFVLFKIIFPNFSQKIRCRV